MHQQKSSGARVWFFTILITYIAVMAVLDLSHILREIGLLDTGKIGDIWLYIGFMEDFVTAGVGITGGIFLFMARIRAEKGGVEGTILLLTGLVALFFGLASVMTGVTDALGDQTYLSVDSPGILTFIAPSIGFGVAAISTIIIVVILIRNSYWILSRTELIVTSVVSILILAGMILFVFLPITSIELSGIMKVVTGVFSLVCVLAFTGTVFAIIAFGRGRGARYWRSLTVGIMFLSFSGLLSIFTIATDNSDWMGLPLLGLTVGVALLARAGYHRWKRLRF
ncbi:hypothetical protein GF359_01495 [candidate division WOR-3 bacterium]|uniref:DUF998 domain-containing protein n=1 Tax=candidate division WOR-3 bacterium TaxID=2052148 RepID=A0A9D5QBV4_UNCW3|nr:hypothetical protein [candidate division WOR-3 bacterium]MBD3363869.1 hypothetical protein [candidate division WOR-3 bacterium]